MAVTTIPASAAVTPRALAGVDAAMALSLSSPAFPDGGPIPDEYGYTKRNVNPPLSVSGAPDDAASLALILDDPDALEPTGKVWVHWVVWNVDPGTAEVPEGWDPSASGAEEGQNDFGGRGYGGPNPPDRVHAYRFELFALSTDLDLPPDATAADVRTAAEGSVLATARLTGTYAP